MRILPLGSAGTNFTCYWFLTSADAAHPSPPKIFASTQEQLVANHPGIEEITQKTKELLGLLMTTQPNHSTSKQSCSGPKHYYFITALMSVSVIYKTFCKIYDETQKTLTNLNNDFDMILLKSHIMELDTAQLKLITLK